MTTFDDARKTLRDFLQDMEALKPFADPANPEAAPFTAAFAAARRRALAAASAYAESANES